MAKESKRPISKLPEIYGSPPRKLHPWGSYERTMQYPWPVSPSEQASHASYWRQKDAKAREVSKLGSDKGMLTKIHHIRIKIDRDREKSYSKGQER